ncbi:hypothetical protein IF1G_04753 [Cordyceps javanica]|uniref:Uncharacterized protein n=1 Tax=Cordyceps javanica TaxID=43265 RepID=A0A545V382_9HYPO|nr:hypothetical protein IF1G_04753 [Cordyceps javanica]TQW07468.1 hypothetical protein IF2G_04629 [Cordyceps javanica]
MLRVGGASKHAQRGCITSGVRDPSSLCRTICVPSKYYEEPQLNAVCKPPCSAPGCFQFTYYCPVTLLQLQRCA